MEWLREQHVPIVNLDCSGSSKSVWQQLQAIGRLMRPAVKVPNMIPPLVNNPNNNNTEKQVSPIWKSEWEETEKET